MKKSILSFTATILAAFSLFAFAGCRSNKVSAYKDNIELIGKWQLSKLSGFKDAEVPELIMDISAVEDVEFGEELSVSGNGGVNTFFATINANHEFPLGANMGMTKMMGSPEEMAIEDALMAVLSTADDWSVYNGMLTITNGKETAVYTKLYGEK